MASLYYYIDECYTDHLDYWHCNVGGAILPVESVVDTEIALEEQIYKLALSDGELYSIGSEFGYSDFFRNASDPFKIRICEALSEVMIARNVRFLVSHAKMQKGKMDFAPFGTPSRQIQMLSYVNIDHYLTTLAQANTVQMIVDLGLSESFRPIYNIYAGARRTIPMLKARGIDDAQITIANYRNLPAPVFLDSTDSRILQYSDLVIGLLLARQLDLLTNFKAKLLAALGSVVANVELYSVEWNADSAPTSNTGF